MRYSITWTNSGRGSKGRGPEGQGASSGPADGSESLLLQATLSRMGIAHLPRRFAGAKVETGALVPVLPAVTGFCYVMVWTALQTGR